MADVGIEGNGLPAFITAPVRVQAESHDSPPPPIETLSPLLVAGAPDAVDAANGFHPRPGAGAGAKRKWRSTKHIAAKRGLPLSRSRIEPRAFRELES